MYKKECRICKIEFESESRNTRYCEKCAGLPASKRAKARARRRRQYSKSLDTNRILSRLYRLSQDLAEMFLEKKCAVCGETDADTLEIHHKDCNPLNLTLINMEWVCKKHHVARHKDLPDVNTPVVLSDLYNDLKSGEINEELMLREIEKVYGRHNDKGGEEGSDSGVSEEETPVEVS